MKGKCSDFCVGVIPYFFLLNAILEGTWMIHKAKKIETKVPSSDQGSQ